MNFSQLLAASAEVLLALPYVAESEERDQALDRMAKELERFSPLQILHWEANACSDPIYRVFATFLLRKVEKTDDAERCEGPTVGQRHVYKGDLHVVGDLELKEESSVVVLGDLTIDGSLVTQQDYPCCFVGGTLRARAIAACEAEISVLEEVHASEAIVAEFYNTILIAKRFVTPLLATEGATLFGPVESARQLLHTSADVLAEALGVQADDALMGVARRAFLGEVPSR